MKRAVIGIDAGGQSFKAAPVDVDTLDLLCAPEFVKIDSEAGRDELLSSFSDIVRLGVSLAESQNAEVIAVAFSCPGPLDYHRGISRMDHKWRSIKGESIPDHLHKTGVIARETPVCFVHDAHSLIFGSALNERMEGRSIAGFIIGTGLGFGIVRNGRPVADEYGVPIFGLFRRPCKDLTLEDYIASKGIPRLYSIQTGSETALDAKAIGDLADEGDAAAVGAYQEMGRILAENVAPILKEYEVDSCVFGGRISNSFGIFGPEFNSKLTALGAGNIDSKHIDNPEAVSIQGAANYALHEMGIRR